MTLASISPPRSFPIVSMRHLEALLGFDRKELKEVAARAGSYYRPFDRKKKGRDKWRHIDNPTDPLKDIQRQIHRRILSNFPFPEYLSGGIPGRSIVDHARPHVGRQVLVNLDLKNCFPSIHDLMVFRAYRELLGCSPTIASLLTQLTTFQHHLPQGAPTSSLLANLVLLPMHEEIHRFCRENGWEYGAFVDDMTISGYAAERAIEPVIRIVRDHGMAVRASKVERMPHHRGQKVTGVNVNRKPSAGRKRIQALREEILAAANDEVMDPAKLMSLWGKVRHVGSICRTQGRSLELFAERLLPKPPANQKTWRIGETRPCRGLSRQRH